MGEINKNKIKDEMKEFKADREAVFDVVEKFPTKVRNTALPDELLKIWTDVETLFHLLSDFLNGNYSVPWKVVSAATFALLYFINPLDAVPDIIPGIGLLDDATVLAVAIKFIKADLEDYKIWRGRN